ncbi:S8 family serine peptidase [Romeria aff. gracilis LEGE 07310]|uniref:S8 family serine peptidase n=1 Tax=Vasconcelosia minhoensis LEGE 07310 TaxID=915328 RepID=A0A8J7DE72_9CYAN|nr:S8 family serine peptidase [Romeria gracilis]MBE9079553.1 S8 family serine peptidase [Romeria aff. gracilis LEGE 07310]
MSRAEDNKLLDPKFLRGVFDITGEGIKLGIVSTSFGASSDVKENVTDQKLSSVKVLKDIPSESVYATGEGRALAQLVYKVAPGSEILFHTGVSGSGSSLSDLNESSFITAVRELQKAGADIIFDDIAGLSPPLFEDGEAVEAIDDAVADGIVYLTAAGNNGTITYEDEYRPSKEFELDNVIFQAHDFDPTDRVDLFQDIVAGENGALLKPLLSWDSSTREESSELFLFVLDSPELPTESNIVNISTIPSKETVEEAVTTQLYSAAPNQKLYYTIGHVVNENKKPPSLIKWVSAANGSDRSVEYEYIDPLLGLPTVYGPANSDAAITVGSASDDGTEYDSFASRGGVPILFDEMGNPLPKPIIRRKPDVIGPDNVTTAFPEGSPFNPFVGTSAAVANVAGVAALMEQAAGGPDVLSPEVIKTILGATDKPVEPAPGLPPSAGLVQPDLAILGAKVTGQIASIFPNSLA